MGRASGSCRSGRKATQGPGRGSRRLTISSGLTPSEALRYRLGPRDHAVDPTGGGNGTEPRIHGAPPVRRCIDNDGTHGRTGLPCRDNALECIGEQDAAKPLALADRSSASFAISAAGTGSGTHRLIRLGASTRNTAWALSQVSRSGTPELNQVRSWMSGSRIELATRGSVVTTGCSAKWRSRVDQGRRRLGSEGVEERCGHGRAAISDHSCSSFICYGEHERGKALVTEVGGHVKPALAFGVRSHVDHLSGHDGHLL